MYYPPHKTAMGYLQISKWSFSQMSWFSSNFDREKFEKAIKFTLRVAKSLRVYTECIYRFERYYITVKLGYNSEF